MNPKLFYLIIGLASKEKDIFVYEYGEFDSEELENIKLEFKNKKDVIILVTDIELGVFKNQINKSIVNFRNYIIRTRYFISENTIVKYLDLSKNIIEILNLSFPKFSHNLLIIEKLIQVAKSNCNFIWFNRDLNNELFENSLFKNYEIITDEFLFSLIKEEYSKYCFAVQFYATNETEHFTSLINGKVDNVFLPKPDFRFRDKGLRYSVSIVRDRNELDEDSLKFTLTEHGNTIIYEWTIDVFGDKYDNPSDCLFVIEKNHVNKFNNLKNYMNNELRLEWVDERLFYEKFKEIKFKETENSCWENFTMFGINFKHHHFYHRYSDFGSDNDIYLVSGNSQYLELSMKKPLIVYEDPASNVTTNGYHSIKNPGKYKGIEENVFEYFYNNNKFVINNIDNIPYEWGTRSNAGLVKDDLKILKSKILKIPDFIIEDSFILSQDYLPFKLY